MAHAPLVIRAALLGSALAALPVTSQADWWQECAAERTRFCQGIEAGGGRIVACLDQHAADLSAGCQTAISTSPGTHTAPARGQLLPTGTSTPETHATTRSDAVSGFRVQGTHIIDGVGHIVRFHGLNSPGLEFGNGTGSDAPACRGRMYGCYHAHDADEYANSARWGFNLVRLPLNWANAEPRAPVGGTHAWNESYLRAIDAAVDEAAQAGLPVILSFHSNNWSAAYPQGGGMPSWLFAGRADPQAAYAAFLANDDRGQEQYIDLLQMIARRYAGRANMIGIDVLNEPRFQPASRQQAINNLQDFYARACARLHAANPRLLLVLQDFVDRDPQLARLPPVPGVIYSFHSYGPWAGARGQSAQAHVAQATRLGVPAFIGEFGRRDYPDWQADMRTFLESVQAENVSWALFAYRLYTYPLYGQLGEGPLDQELLSTVRAGF